MSYRISQPGGSGSSARFSSTTGCTLPFGTVIGGPNGAAGTNGTPKLSIKFILFAFYKLQHTVGYSTTILW